jgi:hypothetical protein
MFRKLAIMATMVLGATFGLCLCSRSIMLDGWQPGISSFRVSELCQGSPDAGANISVC